MYIKRILTDEDIKKVWEDITVLTADNVINFIAKGGSRPVIMSNGYATSLSLDVLSERISMHHLSISNSKGKTDPSIADKMASEILGEGYMLLTVGSISGCIQFIKEKENKRKADE